MAAIVSLAVSARLASTKYALVLLAALQRSYLQLAEAIYEIDRKQTEWGKSVLRIQDLNTTLSQLTSFLMSMSRGECPQRAERIQAMLRKANTETLPSHMRIDRKIANPLFSCRIIARGYFRNPYTPSSTTPMLPFAYRLNTD